MKTPPSVNIWLKWTLATLLSVDFLLYPHPLNLIINLLIFSALFSKPNFLKLLTLLCLSCLLFTPLSGDLDMKFLMMGIFLFSSSLFLKHQKHFFMSLMIIELMMLSNIPMFLALWATHNLIMMTYISFLVISVCEAVMGLSILIKYSRFWGNEMMKI